MVTTQQIVSFPGMEKADLPSVGGKGYSLIRMGLEGLPVPPGIVLTTRFFTSWFDKIRISAAWMELADAPADRWASLSAELKSHCLDLPLADEQRKQIIKQLEAFGEDTLYAVRSSSPDEDLQAVSFAGMYETRLGVGLNDLDDAIRGCFAANLDDRVFAYRRKHGLDILSSHFAVIVQEQIPSEISGIAFSLNPVTNDYDEAVIDSNWGLGESIVAGIASPDHFVIEKVGFRVVERKLGEKQASMWLASEGGILEKRGYSPNKFTLTDARLVELTRQICRIERIFEKPVDIEWAYADDRLSILQARPITVYVPLPPEMLTTPEEPRRLYADAALSKGLTTNEPISPLSLSSMEEMLYSDVLKKLPGIKDFSTAGSLLFTAGGRFYMNLTNLMCLGMNPHKMAKSTAATDVLLSEILANIDLEQYPSPKQPSWLRLRLLLLIPGLLWSLRGFFWNTLRALLAPDSAWNRYQRKVKDFQLNFIANLDYGLPLEEFARTYTRHIWHQMLNVTMPVLIAGMASPDFLIPKKLKGTKELARKLRRGFVGNVVVEQGIALFRLAKMPDRSDFADIETLAGRIERREMPVEFMKEWDAFQQRFGCRGPNEMDLARPRYADEPALALRQMSFMAVEDGFDPETVHRRNIKERRTACEELIRRLSWPRRMLLRRVHRLIELFGGSRDTPKYHIVMIIGAIRKRALMEGMRLSQKGILDAPEDIFNLTLQDLRAAERDPAPDLRDTVRERTRSAIQLAAQVTEFPQVIDSRGRILRPAPRGTNPDELIGMPISPGVVKGPVKLLRHAYDKGIEKGDVLVAYTTDPGWTPLFVNAAAVVIEVGGMLQHGAVIAREYGKPCVAGIDQLMKKLHDGQRVEVNGTTGIVRLL